MISADEPEMVTLVANATENKDCSDLWVNFICSASQANPAVDDYHLYGSEEGPSVRKSGTWVKKISKEGGHVYSCLAQHRLRNVASANKISLTLNGEFW